MIAIDWVNVEDRLPELGESVLVSGSFDGLKDIDQWFTHRTDDSRVLVDSNGFAVYDEKARITHWMKIVPPDYKPKEDIKQKLKDEIRKVYPWQDLSETFAMIDKYL